LGYYRFENYEEVATLFLELWRGLLYKFKGNENILILDNEKFFELCRKKQPFSKIFISGLENHTLTN